MNTTLDEFRKIWCLKEEVERFDTLDFICNLKEFRKQKGYTQKQLANLTGVNLRMIQGYEQGTKDINKASFETIYKLCVVLDIEFCSLLNWNDELKDFWEQWIKIKHNDLYKKIVEE